MIVMDLVMDVFENLCDLTGMYTQRGAVVLSFLLFFFPCPFTLSSFTLKMHSGVLLYLV